jgi:asparagine synthase (glutamine-hydrolysing)
MCGIAGIYNPEGVAVNDVVSLSKTLRHRGPDDEGFFLSYTGNISEHFRGDDTIEELRSLKHISENGKQSSLALMHRRLSILDVSEMGHQPLVSDNERYVIVFNGEVYNYKEIRQELISKGHQFKSESDTEVVLNSFVEWGEKCVERFVGMWAFVIHDKQENTLVLSRDRYGVKPLYFYQRGSYFAFASEIKALLKLSKVDSRISNEDLGSFLSYGSTANPYQNLFLYIEDIQPGSNYRYDLNTGMLTKTPYYYLEKSVQQEKTSLKENIEKFEALFDDSMALHLRSDVEIGSCLSGGLDSSAIVYSASKQLQNVPLKTFTASYKNKAIDESDYAQLVANKLPNVKDVYIYPEAKTLVSDMDKMLYHQDLPIGSTSIFAQWEVMKCANQHQIKVLLDGQGADETLGGYTNFGGIYLVELLKEFKFNQFFKEYRRLKRNFTPKIRQGVLKAAYYYLPSNLQQRFRAKERLSYNFINTEHLGGLELAVPQRGGKTFKEHSELSMKFGMYDLLRYEDRNSMAFSIESRVPFLDHRLVEMIRSLPNNHKIHKGWSKYVLRKMLDQKVDQKVVWRKDKKGFVTPQQDWKNELMSTLTSELKDSDMPSLVNRDYVIELCGKDFSNASHLSEFWRAYSVVKWYNLFNLKA